ncbi:MAG: hypothetical protein SFY96_08445 [Planctomycetota bacterium]|nr:hypothetical protein [Planctomycetota bacterium]
MQIRIQEGLFMSQGWMTHWSDAPLNPPHRKARSGPVRAAALTLMAAAALGAALLAGCSSIPEADDLSLLPVTARYDSSRPFSIDVENKGGSVDVIVNPKFQRPRVTARVVDFKTGQPVKDEAAAQRKWISANLSPRADSTLVRVVNTKGAVEGTGLYIWITIEVPSCDGVRIRNSAGGVSLKDVGGPIDVANGYGSGEGGPITIRTTQRLVDPVTLSTSDGEIFVAMSGRSSGTIDLATVNGPVELRDRTAQVTNILQTANTWTGVLNDASNPIKIRSGGGLVRVEINPDKTQR